jgi:hypothetical protein
MNLVHALPSSLFKILYNIINLPFMPRSSKLAIHFTFPYQNHACIVHTPYLSHRS